MLSEPVLRRQLKSLLSEGLYDSAEIIAQCIVTEDTENIDVLMSYAKILEKKKEYMRATKYYQKVLMVTEKNKKSAEKEKADIKYKVAQCYFKLSETKAGFRALLSIPKEHRSIKVLLALAKGYRSQNQFNHAKNLYSEILHRNPLAIEALIALAQMEVDPSALLKSIDARKIGLHLALGYTTREPNKQEDFAHHAKELVSLQENLVNGHCSTSASSFPVLLKSFTNIQQSYPLHLHSLQQIALGHTQQGNYDKAKYAFESLYTFERSYIRSMDVYGHILKTEGKVMALNKLAHSLLSIDRYAPESWVVMAQYCELKNLKNDATVFVEKAVTLAEGKALDAFSLVVRGELQLSLKRPAQAVQSFIQAYANEKDFSVYRGLVHSYLKLRKFDESLRFAKEAWAKIHNAQSLTLLGNVLMSTPLEDGKVKARKFLERALKLDPYCFEAVMALVDLDIAEKKFQTAIDLLNKQKEREQKRIEYIYAKLGDIAVLGSNPAEAMMCYHTALQINPHFQPALDGLEVLEKQLHRLKAESDEEEDEEILSESGSELEDSFDSFM